MDKKQRKKSVNYMKYSGMAFQLGITIAIGAFIGVKLDEWMGNEQQYMTIVFVLIFAFAGFYVTLKDLL